MQRYIGLDVHSRSCTFGVIGESGKRLRSQVSETAPQPLIAFIKSVAGQRHVCLEEGTQSAWIYELIKPHVETVTVTHQAESKGPIKGKDDIRDAFALAESLRIGSVTPVYKESKSFGRLKSVVDIYSKTSFDTVRIQNRIKALFRSRGVDTSGQTIYSVKHRQEWMNKLTDKYQASAEVLFEQYDMMRLSKNKANKLLVEELYRHPISRVLKSCPGFGEIRSAQLMATVVSPARFRTKRQLWSYSGLAIVMRSSSDWEKRPDGWRRSQRMQTRGLNRNFNRTLKRVFKGAATSVIEQRQGPLYDQYLKMLENGTKPPLAKLTLARKIAAIALVLWKTQEAYNPAYETKKE
jgi:transposase